jgi:hypothetical protein
MANINWYEHDSKDIKEYIERTDYKEQLKSIRLEEPPDLSGGFNIADIEKYYPQIDMKWEYASNTTIGGVTKQRTYTELEFNLEDEIKIEIVDFPYYQEDLGGQHFYKLTFPFYEWTYSSDGDFYKWELDRYKYLFEGFYPNKENEVITIDNLTNRQSIEIELGKALGILIQSDSNNLNIKYKEQLYKEGDKIEPLTKESLDIEWSIPSPNYIDLHLYGMEMSSKSIHPLGELEEDSEILIHRVEVPLDKRYLPPGRKDFPTEFWNTRDISNLPKVSNYFNRVNNTVRWK